MHSCKVGGRGAGGSRCSLTTLAKEGDLGNAFAGGSGVPCACVSAWFSGINDYRCYLIHWIKLWPEQAIRKYYLLMTTLRRSFIF